jgi:hypothetical protein
MLEAAAETDELRAVVSEGAGARAFSDEMDEADERDESGPNKLLNAAAMAAEVGAITVFTNQSPPPNVKDVVGRIAPRPVMLIAAPNSKNGERLSRGYYAAAHEAKTLWEIPEAGHMGGIRARPAEYERRVVGFFDDALL